MKNLKEEFHGTRKPEVEILWELYTDPELETKESISDYIREENLKADEWHEQLMRTIRKEIAKQKLKNGKLLNQKLNEEMNNQENIDETQEHTKLAFAFRSLKKPDSSDEEFIKSEEDKKKLEVLKRIAHKKNGSNPPPESGKHN